MTRSVVALPDGYTFKDEAVVATERVIDADRAVLSDAQQRFWAEFLEHLNLDDPEQPIPKPPKLGYLSFTLPAPSGNCWLTVYRNMKAGEVGVFVSSSRNTLGEVAMLAIVDQWERVRDELGPSAKLIERDGRQTVSDTKVFGSLDDAEIRKRAFAWLAERVNAFVNATRPRVRSAMIDHSEAADFGSA